jgi:LmbE family N-acetylglucosaminyl deacetylase
MPLPRKPGTALGALARRDGPLLLISPHLDDVAFSCAGTISRLRRAGRRVMWATVFSAGKPDPSGFALECQTSKGIAAGRDYMRLRWDEDFAAARILGAQRPLRLGFLEAPHRGYESADALFGPLRAEDLALPRRIATALTRLIARVQPAAVWLPLGVGAHVDHVLVARAAAFLSAQRMPVLYRYLDVPYVIQAGALPKPLDPHRRCLRWRAVRLDSKDIDRSSRAAAAYASQLGYQLRTLGSVRHMVEQSRRRMAKLAGCAAYRVELFAETTA